MIHFKKVLGLVLVAMGMAHGALAIPPGEVSRIAVRALSLCYEISQGSCMRSSDICTYNTEESGECKTIVGQPDPGGLCKAFNTYGPQAAKQGCSWNPTRCYWQVVPAGCSPRSEVLTSVGG